MDNFKRKIKEAWEENPLAVIGVAALAATALAKLMDAATSRRYSRIHEREVSRRVAKDRRNY